MTTKTPSWDNGSRASALLPLQILWGEEEGETDTPLDTRNTYKLSGPLRFESLIGACARTNYI